MSFELKNFSVRLALFALLFSFGFAASGGAQEMKEPAMKPASTAEAKSKGPRKPNPNTEYGKVQTKLKELGLYKGEVTGFKNPETAEALRAYQKQNGLKETGTLSAETREKFGLPARKTAAKKATTEKAGMSDSSKKS
jgi:peptidoglycan hydrolase-like protein with peptidoglycan-binding domain